MEKIVLIDITSYKESTGESTINLIFATLLLTKNLIIYDIVGNFDHDSEHQSILFKWTIHTIDNLLSLRLFWSKIDILALKKALIEELAKDPPRTSIMPNEWGIKVYSLINVIDIAMILAISKAKLSPK